MSPFPKKKDPSITFLNKFGYNVIKEPRQGIEPMDVIGRDTTTILLGKLSRVWQSTGPAPDFKPKDPPSPGKPQPAVAINGQRTDALDLSLGLSILANTLQAFGASVPSLDLAYKSAHSVQFAYSNVTSTSVELFEAGEYLIHGKLSTDNPVVRNYFFNEKARAYLIVEVLKSNAITVTAADSHGVNVAVDLPAIEGALKAKIGVSPSDASNSTLTFTGPEAITFGFKVQQILRQGETWVLQGAAPSGDIAFLGPKMGPGASAQPGPANPLVFDTGDEECRLSLESAL